MLNSSFTRWFFLWFLAVVLLLCISLGIRVAAATGNAGRPANDSRLEMVTALEATGPHPSLGDHASVFDRLVGSWDVEYTDFAKDGKVTHRSGELMFGWVLDGRVMQDFWIVYPSGTHKDREVYTDLLYFDSKAGTWLSVFIDPQEASVATFTGSAVGEDRIVLDSHDLVPQETRRWSYNDIRPDSLVYRDEASSDGGKTWTLKSEYHMKRRASAPPVR